MLQKTRNHAVPFDAAAAVVRVRVAIYDGGLATSDLTARNVARFLGLTTSVFYHHYGSFELFLYAVAVAGLSTMADELAVAAQARSPLLGIAEYYVTLALERPALFDLMIQRPFPWAEIRAKNLLDTNEALRAWNILIAAVRDAGSTNPREDARLFHAAIHGLATLTRGGRMNVDDLEHTDEQVARRTARRLVRMFRCGLAAGATSAARSRATPRAVRRSRRGTAR